jgi:restriction system protein
VSTLQRVHPTTFERVVAKALERNGWRDVVHVGGPGDGGVDVRAATRQGAALVTQVKRYASHRPVGQATVQALAGVMQLQGAEHGMVVTTSRFTSGAQRTAAEHGIELIDGASIRGFLRGT